MAIKLYNTMSRSIEDFVPEDASRIGMYVCGPTVYDDAHIGNARPVIVFDVLFRLLREVYGAEHVAYARNITDVDDKINARALSTFPALEINEAVRTLTTATESRFRSDVQALLCLDPTWEPRATDNIEGMLAIIGALVSRGHAYVVGDEVLFSVGSMVDYGGLSNRDLSTNRSGARIATDEHKRDPADFVLWKGSTTTEPGWESPWGRGRPGWHIECSAMSARYLGETFDIHGGGIDLVFPHHENEIAQSRCAHGTDRMARYWVHNGFVMINGRKMSKSEGNFVTINELLRTDKFGGRNWPGEVLRLSMLMNAYREPLDFTERRLLEAENVLASWPMVETTDSLPDAEVVARLSDDLDTVGALRAVQALAVKAKTSDAALEAFSASASLMGIGSKAPALSMEMREHIDGLVSERSGLIVARDWTGADAVRSSLSTLGVGLADYKDAATGERRTRWSIVDAGLAQSASADQGSGYRR